VTSRAFWRLTASGARAIDAPWVQSDALKRRGSRGIGVQCEPPTASSACCTPMQRAHVPPNTPVSGIPESGALAITTSDAASLGPSATVVIQRSPRKGSTSRPSGRQSASASLPAEVNPATLGPALRKATEPDFGCCSKSCR